jgi:hypothetical protein
MRRRLREWLRSNAMRGRKIVRPQAATHFHPDRVIGRVHLSDIEIH